MAPSVAADVPALLLLNIGALANFVPANARVPNRAWLPHHGPLYGADGLHKTGWDAGLPTHRRECAMPFYEKGDVRIRFEEPLRHCVPVAEKSEAGGHLIIA
jgi:hypothetical protein